MRDIEEHRKIVRQIADLAFANAVKSPDLKELCKTDPKDWNKDIREKFIIKVHEGFKEAQNILIEKIIYYQDILRDKRKSLKEYNRSHDSENKKKTNYEIKVISQRLSTLAHIADGIAWQLIGGEIHIARRFYIEEDSSKFLDSSNIEHAKKVADKINESPLDFALISDLTNYVQIGDILVKHENYVSIMELKEGKINDQIKEFVDELERNSKSVTDEILKEKFDDKTVKQAKRMQRQKIRAERVTEIVNNDKGIDPVSEQPIRISTPQIRTEGYHDQFIELLKNLDSKTWAYTVVENCLHIGMYRDEGILMAGFAIENILKEETDNFIIVDWLSITNNLSEPIFSKPFPADFIIDVLTGKIKIILGLNLDNLIELFNLLGLETKWLNKKETAKAKQNMGRKGIVVINNKAISLNLHKYGGDVIMSGGIISKILYDNILPSNIALTMMSTEPMKE